MSRTSPNVTAPPRRGAMLFEVMLSVALFVGAAAFCLDATRSLFSALDRAKRQQQAVDLARSKIAELEAGLITLADLHDEWSGAIGSHQPSDDFDPEDRRPRWSFDVQTSRTEFRGLTLVELTVREIPAEILPDTQTHGAGFTLRQLVALREVEAEAYEPDELLEGLLEDAP